MGPAKFQPALLGGVVIGVLSALPVINVANCCCAWILFGGALAAYLMQQNHPDPINVGDGAIVGLMAGVAGAFVWAVASVPIGIAMAPFQARMTQEALRNATEIAPEMRAFLEQFSGGPTIGFGILLGFFVMLAVSTLFGMLGGLFGALLFRKKTPPVIPPPIPPQVF
jgi:uncharacterized membrane protein (Fun14 family)